MDEQDIITQVLLKLDGWVLETDIDDLTDIDYNRTVTEDEILQTYGDATEYAKSYLQRNDTGNIPVWDTAVVFWTAGIIWAKYNQNVNNNTDETNPNPWGYGDKLVIQAKEMLKPFKSFVFQAF